MQKTIRAKTDAFLICFLMLKYCKIISFALWGLQNIHQSKPGKNIWACHFPLSCFEVRHSLRLQQPQCLELGEDKVLMIDHRLAQGKYLLDRDNFEPLEFELNGDQSQALKLALLNGSATVLRDYEYQVEQLLFTDKNVVVTSAKNTLAMRRSQFALIQVPQSIFQLFS